MGEGPLYEHIEFCRNAETLWHKLQSGRWDWLGVHPRGQFVLGTPARNEPQVFAPGIQSTDPGADSGQNGIKFYIWLGYPGSPPGAYWFASPKEARSGFEKKVADLDRPEQAPILARVIHLENGYPTDEKFIAQIPPPNYR